MIKDQSKQMTTEEIRRSQIGILDYVDEICGQNDITYYLAAGTLIGAVRHKGYIPWDDDIDLFMKRADYEKLISVMCGGNDKNGRYRLMSLQTDEGYYYPYIKVVDTRTEVEEMHMKQIPGYGVWVDIFPLDYFDENLADAKKLKALNLKLRLASQQKIYLSGNKLKDMVKRFVHLFYKLRDPRKIAEKIDALAQCTAQATDKLYIGLSPVGDKDKFNAEWFSKTVRLEFEGKLYSAPIGYDGILRHRYGDYMQLPPENQRVSNHDYVACWRKQ